MHKEQLPAIVTLSAHDPRLFDFRQKIYREDLKVDPRYLEEDLSHRQCQKLFPTKDWEEIYKYGRLKWSKVQFDGVTAAINSAGQIVSIAGYKRYEDFVRIGMHLYTLKRHRGHFRSLLWRKNGFIDQAEGLPENNHCRGLFLTIYPHNPALRAWSRRLSQKANFAQMGQEDSSVFRRMETFLSIEVDVVFNGVPQRIFYVNKEPEKISDDECKKKLLKIINRTHSLSS